MGTQPTLLSGNEFRDQRYKKFVGKKLTLTILCNNLLIHLIDLNYTGLDYLQARRRMLLQMSKLPMILLEAALPRFQACLFRNFFAFRFKNLFYFIKKALDKSVCKHFHFFFLYTKNIGPITESNSEYRTGPSGST